MSKVEPNLYDHEERIVNLEGNVREIQEDLRERYARIDESNKYLRELSQEQIKQNGHILNSVLTGNQEAAKRQDEMKKAAAKTRADLWLKAIGSGGVFYLIVDMIMKLLK
jgi:septal ring factor EnvC (AmiA/AmiB activator)